MIKIYNYMFLFKKDFIILKNIENFRRMLYYIRGGVIMQKTKLSIIMPAYNSAGSVKASVESVLSNKSTDFELIVINDGSTDSTEDIVKSFNDSRLIYISKKNSGVSSTRNFGLKKATGEYITFIDSDDMYVDGAVDKILEYIEKYSFDMLGFGFYKEFIKGGRLYKTDANAVSDNLIFDMTNAPEYFRYIFESSHILFQTSWNKVLRRDIIADNGIEFNEKLVCYENLTMIFDYLMYANKVVFVNDILYRYNNNADGSTNVIGKRNKLELTADVSACYMNFLKLCDRYDYPKNYRDFMNAAFLEDYVFCSRKYFIKSDKYTSKQRFEAFERFLNDEGFLMLRKQYLSNMSFFRILFMLNDRGLKHIAYKIYEKRLIK